jgi:hypothetical protein
MIKWKFDALDKCYLSNRVQHIPSPAFSIISPYGVELLWLVPRLCNYSTGIHVWLVKCSLQALHSFSTYHAPTHTHAHTRTHTHWVINACKWLCNAHIHTNSSTHVCSYTHYTHIHVHMLTCSVIHSHMHSKCIIAQVHIQAGVVAQC